MDNFKVVKMKIFHILPELQIGGVERHVIDLANEQAKRGHSVTVISAGGQMETQFVSDVEKVHIPVHLKNPFTAVACAFKIAKIARSRGVDIIHAHSRVPALIAMLASRKAKIPYVVSAHCVFGTKTRWIYLPYRKANVVICVSKAVQDGMKNCFYDNTKVIVNGFAQPKEYWSCENWNAKKLLFVGRLSNVKGLQDVLQAIPTDLDWTMDVVGDGPQRAEWEKIAKERGISERITFHGYSDKVEHFLANASCLLFPSYTEGMPLTLAQAILVGTPVLASNIQPVVELKGSSEGLLPPGDINAWKKALTDLLNGKMPQKLPKSSVPTLENMVDEIEKTYVDCIKAKI